MEYLRPLICWIVVLPGYFPFNAVQGYKWIKLDEYGVVPASAFVGGQEDGEFLYVSKVHFDFGVRDGVFPGKLKKNYCYITYYGREYSSGYGCEVLVDFKGHWVNVSHHFPKRPIVGGHDEEYDSLYIGRAKINNDFIIGKVQLEYDFTHYKDGLNKTPVLYVPYGGSEIEVKKDFEVLSRN